MKAATRRDPATAATARDPFHLRMTLAISATAFVGFWFTYFGPILQGTYPSASPAVHVHGWSFFAWYLLLPLQATLIRARNVRLHRRLGSVSVALVGIMVATGLLVVGVRMDEALAQEGPTFWSLFGPMIFSTLVLFGAFYSAALAFRRRGSYHKRLLILAGTAGLGAALFRIVTAAFGPVMWAAPVGILATNLFIVGAMLRDRVREGRVHAVYVVGLPVALVVEVATLWVPATPAGQALTQALAWIGGTFAALY